MRRERTQCVVIGTPPGVSGACVSAIMFADDDLMTLQHAVEMFQALPNAELAIVPGTSHFLTQEKRTSTGIVLDLLTLDPVPTVAAIRRAPQTGPTNSSTEAAAQR